VFDGFNNKLQEEIEMWVIYALLSAIAAAFVAIFAKIGLRSVDPVLATTIRSVIMAAFLLIFSLATNRIGQISASTFHSKEWIMILLAAVAGALSWLFYFLAIKLGKVSAVAAIDRLSIVFVVALAAIFLNETAGFKSIFGAVLIIIGAILISI
jgi:transporter family protein